MDRSSVCPSKRVDQRPTVPFYPLSVSTKVMKVDSWYQFTILRIWGIISTMHSECHVIVLLSGRQSSKLILVFRTGILSSQMTISGPAAFTKCDYSISGQMKDTCTLWSVMSHIWLEPLKLQKWSGRTKFVEIFPKEVESVSQWVRKVTEKWLYLTRWSELF